MKLLNIKVGRTDIQMEEKGNITNTHTHRRNCRVDAQLLFDSLQQSLCDL